MADEHRRPALEKFEPALKRRKVRKGTQSCWECKRRKIRCTFATLPDAVCDGCKSRGTRCVGQQFDEETGPVGLGRASSLGASSEKHVGSTLGRLETLAEELMTAKSPADTRTRPAVESQPRPVHRVSKTNRQTQGSRWSEEYGDLYDALLAAWPSPRDLELILSIPATNPGAFSHGLICVPYRSLMNLDLPSPRDVLKLPPKGAHPVLVARRLLLLGSYLQSLPPSSLQNLKDGTGDFHEIMNRVVDTATRQVTSDDILVSSIDGIECIMIEGMYQNNAGNLRRAWLTNRRGMGIAQMMGLHALGHTSSQSSQSLKFLDPATRNRIDPEHLWIRLVHTDRYLSLMLGLPQAWSESEFASNSTLDHCTPMERLERLDSVAGSRILQRHSGNALDLATTLEIDSILQHAASCMPPQWWLVPNLAPWYDAESFTYGGVTRDDIRALQETLRSMAHFTHFHILAQLHLPYVLRPSSDGKYDYSKITAVTASRELLTRFVYFHGGSKAVTRTPHYCRGVDCIAFIASTTLCLAHLAARGETLEAGGNNNNVFACLVHQRIGDRGLMDQTLQIMERMARNNDRMASRISTILRTLLQMEQDASSSGNYYRTSSEGLMDRDEVGECRGEVSPCGNVLSIHIPCFGTIKIERGSVVKEPEKTPEMMGGSEDTSPTLTNSEDHDRGHLLDSGLMADMDQDMMGVDGFVENYAGDDNLYMPGLDMDLAEWPLQGVDMALFDSLFGGFEPSGMDNTCMI